MTSFSTESANGWLVVDGAGPSGTSMNEPKESTLESFGFSFARSGPHLARTMMLNDLQRLLDGQGVDTPTGQIMAAVEDDIAERFRGFCGERSVGPEDVVALFGVGCLFGFLKVKTVVDRLAPMVPGRLVVFFPGSYEDNNYRLLDAYDGWGYLAVPITADS